MIPDFDPDGTLPPGIHDATFPELASRYCGRSLRRSHLTNRLRNFYESVHDVVIEFYVDGSYITEKLSPGDIDVLLIVYDDFVTRNQMEARSILHYQQNKNRYHLHLFFVKQSQQKLIAKHLDWFTQTRNQQPKGIIRLKEDGHDQE